jgi:hypothetical protein
VTDTRPDDSAATRDHPGHGPHRPDTTTGHGHGHGNGHGHGERSGLWSWVRSVFRPHSHDAADSVDAVLEASADGVRAVKISLVALLITALAQATVVVVTGSVALLADTIHNFSDALGFGQRIPRIWTAWPPGGSLRDRAGKGWCR